MPKPDPQTTLVKRLRAVENKTYKDAYANIAVLEKLCVEAAEEIERLRKYSGDCERFGGGGNYD